MSVAKRLLLSLLFWQGTGDREKERKGVGCLVHTWCVKHVLHLSAGVKRKGIGLHCVHQCIPSFWRKSDVLAPLLPAQATQGSPWSPLIFCGLWLEGLALVSNTEMCWIQHTFRDAPHDKPTWTQSPLSPQGKLKNHLSSCQCCHSTSSGSSFSLPSFSSGDTLMFIVHLRPGLSEFCKAKLRWDALCITPGKVSDVARIGWSVPYEEPHPKHTEFRQRFYIFHIHFVGEVQTMLLLWVHPERPRDHNASLLLVPPPHNQGPNFSAVNHFWLKKIWKAFAVWHLHQVEGFEVFTFRANQHNCTSAQIWHLWHCHDCRHSGIIVGWIPSLMVGVGCTTHEEVRCTTHGCGVHHSWWYGVNHSRWWGAPLMVVECTTHDGVRYTTHSEVWFQTDVWLCVFQVAQVEWLANSKCFLWTSWTFWAEKQIC